MKKILLVVLVLVALSVAAFAAISRGTPESNTNTPAQNTNTNTDQPTAAAGAVTMANMMFTPPQITVQKGSTVTWTNNDSVAHTVTDDLSNVGGPDSGTIAAGGTYSFTFTKSGSYQYHCKLHTSMRGTIVVQ
jgi:plastocyanin